MIRYGSVNDMQDRSPVEPPQPLLPRPRSSVDERASVRPSAG